MNKILISVSAFLIGCSTGLNRPHASSPATVELLSNAAARTNFDPDSPILLSGLFAGDLGLPPDVLLAQLKRGVSVQRDNGVKVSGDTNLTTDYSANNYFELSFKAAASMQDGWYEIETGPEFARAVTFADVGLKLDTQRGYVARFRVGSEPLLVQVSRCTDADKAEFLEVRFSERMLIPGSMASTVRLTPLESSTANQCEWHGTAPMSSFPPMSWPVSCGSLPKAFALQITGASAAASGLEAKELNAMTAGVSREFREEDFSVSRGDCKMWTAAGF